MIMVGMWVCHHGGCERLVMVGVKGCVIMVDVGACHHSGRVSSWWVGYGGEQLRGVHGVQGVQGMWVSRVSGCPGVLLPLSPAAVIGSRHLRLL